MFDRWLSAAITSPSAESDLLIEFASFSCCWLAPVFAARSDPAKSMSENLPRFTAPVVLFVTSSRSERTKCDRDDSAFILVEDVFRFVAPRSKISVSSSTVVAAESKRFRDSLLFSHENAENGCKVFVGYVLLYTHILSVILWHRPFPFCPF